MVAEQYDGEVLRVQCLPSGGWWWHLAHPETGQKITSKKHLSEQDMVNDLHLWMDALSEEFLGFLATIEEVASL